MKAWLGLVGQGGWEKRTLLTPRPTPTSYPWSTRPRLRERRERSAASVPGAACAAKSLAVGGPAAFMSSSLSCVAAVGGPVAFVSSSLSCVLLRFEASSKERKRRSLRSCCFSSVCWDRYLKNSSSRDEPPSGIAAALTEVCSSACRVATCSCFTLRVSSRVCMSRRSSLKVALCLSILC